MNHPSSQLRLLAASVLVLLASSALAQSTLHVPAEYPTIQQAIDAASNGDEIIVAPGTYNEAIILFKALHLRSAEGPQTTVVDATGIPFSAMRCHNCGPNTIIEGLTFTGGIGSEISGQRRGGGIYNSLGKGATIVNCIFAGNTADRGGGMYNLECSPTIVDCMFDGNVAVNLGGGIYQSTSAGSVIINCVFTDNTAFSGGGMASNNSSPALIDCVFLGNSAAPGEGGAIWFSDGRPSLANCVFDSNFAAFAGGAVTSFSNTLTVSNCEFLHNTTDGVGGAVNILGFPSAAAAFTDCTFVGNSSDWSSGAIEFAAFSSELGEESSMSIEQCLFYSNTSRQAGAVHVLCGGPGDIVITQCVFSGNIATGPADVTAGAGAMEIRLFDTASAILADNEFDANWGINVPGVLLLTSSLANPLAPHLRGSGMIGDGILSFGGLRIGDGSNRYALINGDYNQSVYAQFGGNLGVEIGGTEGGVEHDLLAVAGTATLAGLLDVSLINDFKPSLGDAFAILTAAAIINPFDVAYFPQMPPGLVMRLHYNHGVAANASATLAVEELAMLLGFGGASSIGLEGAATAVAVGDFNGDDALDIAITLRGETPADPGSVLVLFNDGDGETFTGVQYTVGREPSAIVVADLTGNDSPDIAITNAGDNNVSILLNDGSGDFALPVNVNAGAAPSGIAAGDLTGSGDIDLAVSNLAGNSLSVLLNDGSGSFSTTTIGIGGAATAVALGDLDGDGALDIAVTRLEPSPTGSGHVVLLFNDGDGASYQQAALPVGQGPRTVIIDDLDNDKDLDILVGNVVSGTISVGLNGGGGVGGFAPAVSIPMNGEPLSMTAFDMNASGVPDLAIVVNDADLGLVVRILRNDFDPVTGQLAFTHVEDLGEGEHPVLVTNGDVTGDGFDDLITINAPPQEASAGGGPESSLSIRPNLLGGPPTNPADLNGDNVVDVLDLLILLDYWGACPGKGQPCPADFNDDGSVDVLDLLFLLDNWG